MSDKELVIYVESKVEEIKKLKHQDKETVIKIGVDVMHKVRGYIPGKSTHPEMKELFIKDKLFYFNELSRVLIEIEKDNETYIADNFWFVKFLINGSVKFLR